MGVQCNRRGKTGEMEIHAGFSTSFHPWPYSELQNIIQALRYVLRELLGSFHQLPQFVVRMGHPRAISCKQGMDFLNRTDLILHLI